MKVINREILNKNLKVKSIDARNNEIITHQANYREIIDAINRAKTYLLKEKNAQPGQKILLAANGWPQYLIWFIASVELGLSFVVSDHPTILNSESVANKLKSFGEIDYLIGDLNSEEIKWYPSLIDKFVDRNVFFSYTDQSHKDTFLCKETDVLLWSTSSGTTDTPKVISHTHKFFYELLERNAKLYNLKESDKCLHTKGLHHGSVTGVYFFPTIKYCSEHYYAPSDKRNFAQLNDNIYSWVNVIQKEKINRCLMFYTMLDDFCKLASLKEKTHDDLTIYVLSKISKDNIDIAVEKFNYKIYSIFGCTETSGPLFFPSITKDNLSNFNENNFGPVLDDFYKISINQNGKLLVEMPNGEIVETGDKFSIHGNDFLFEGRENIYRLDGKAFYLNEMIRECENILKKRNGQEFDIVLDPSMNCIYIRVDSDLDLDEFNVKLENKFPDPSYRIYKKLVAPRDQFITGIKLDLEEIRIRCRKIV